MKWIKKQLKKKEKIEDNKKREIESKREEGIERTPKKTSFIDMVVSICMFFIKFIVIICLVGVIFYLIGMAFALGLGIYLLIKGVTYFGIFILLIALFQGGILLLELGIYFVWNKKMKAGRILAEVITIIIITGIGLSLSTIEIANTKIIYDSSYEDKKSTIKEIEVNDTLALYGNYNIVIDNSLTDRVKIEYVYPDINDIEVSISLNYYDNGYYLDEKVDNFSWNKDLMDRLIEDLKDKEIHVDNFEIEKNVYMSEETKELLFKNKEISNNDNNVIYEFTRTYNVRNVEESNDEAYVYLTLRQFQFEEVATVKVLKSMASNIEEGNNYEFTFRYNYPSTEIENDAIEELFSKCNLISIKYTDKVGLEQTQEPEIPIN